MSGKGRPGPEEVVARVEQEEFERGRRAPGAPAASPRPAATLVVARRARRAFEVLLLRRPDTARFAAGAFVFPGGVIDAGDADPAVVGVLPPDPERPALAAALRELFEETGILLADDPPGEAADALRARLLEDRVDFRAVLAELGVRFDRIRAAYIARWITPAALARRYDTRFFLVESDGTDPALTAEHTEWLWSEPGSAVLRFRTGELPMLFPTWKTLEGLARFDGLDEAFRAYEGRPVEPILAKLDLRGERPRPLMPGDPGYDEVE